MTDSPYQTEPTQRFSNRVANYVQYRPSYPPDIVSFLSRDLPPSPSHPIADIGSGTGLLTQIFLEHGYWVYGVEPNKEMRQAGEQFLANYAHFTSINGTAEATTLPDQSVDLIVAGQAFHWFDPVPTRREFQRILKPNGHVALIWNMRGTGTPFWSAYEDLLYEYAFNYKNKRAANQLDTVDGWLTTVQLHHFKNEKSYGFPSLKGRLLSSSYAP